MIRSVIRRRALILAAIAVVISTILLLFFPRVRQTLRERRPLPKGECTWYAFERAKAAGWNIRFDTPYNRHALNWPEKILNADRSSTPRPGAVMILDSWPANPYGHVAYVERVITPDRWTVTHANFRLGTQCGVRDGVPIYAATCTITPKGVRFEGTPHDFKLRTFLYRPLETRQTNTTE